jgi:hypothetical protein
MRYLVILSILFLSIPSVAQDFKPEQVLDSIKSRALERGIDLSPLIEAHLDTILILEPHQFPKPKNDRLSEIFATAKYLGRRKGKWYWEIRLSNELFNDYNLLERVLAHELGHVFGLKHCCVEGSECYDDFVCLEIMSDGHITDKDKHPFFYNAQWDAIYWDNYFNLIKDL